MEIGIGLLLGAILGIVIGYFLVRLLNKAKTDEINKKSDLVVQEARLTTKRMIGEAELKAEKIMSNAESKNESIKQRKIREAKERFAKLKMTFIKKKMSIN